MLVVGYLNDNARPGINAPYQFMQLSCQLIQAVLNMPINQWIFRNDSPDMTTSFLRCIHPPVSQLVKSFWQTQGQPMHRSETILPKGVIELIFSFGKPVALGSQGNNFHWQTPRCFVNGMSDHPVCLQTPEQQSFFGIELHPIAVKKLLKIPSGEFLNIVTSLEEIQKEFGSLWHQLAEADLFEQRVMIVQNWMERKTIVVPEQEKAISDFLSSIPEPVSVAALAKKLCYSPRQLNRKSQELFGMSTEALIRYNRYLHSLYLMHQSKETLTRITYDCLYYDQSHFNREFKDFAGMTPGEYRQQKSHLPGHLFQNVRYVQ